MDKRIKYVEYIGWTLAQILVKKDPCMALGRTLRTCNPTGGLGEWNMKRGAIQGLEQRSARQYLNI